MSDMNIAELLEINQYNDGKYRITPPEYNALLEQCEQKMNTRHNAARNRLKDTRDSAIVPINNKAATGKSKIENMYSTDRDRLLQDNRQTLEKLQTMRNMVGRDMPYNLGHIWAACALIPLLSFILIFVGCTMSCKNSHRLMANESLGICMWYRSRLFIDIIMEETAWRL